MWFSRIRNRHAETDLTSAEQAVTEAQASLEAALEREAEVRRLVADLRFQRVEVNHIGERIRASFGGTND